MSIFNASISGASPLNFTVVGGTTRPTSPKENTIWVKTNLAVSCWELSGITWMPAYAAATGYVYLQIESGYWTGDEAWATDTNFLATKKNNIFTYLKLVGCVQNQDGTGSGWKKMEAYIYKPGNWIQFSDEFDDFLFNYGSVNEEVTGGWAGRAVPINGTSAGTPTATSNGDGSVTLRAPESTSGIYITGKKIDLTNYSTLTFYGYTYDPTNFACASIRVWSDIGTVSNNNVVATFFKNSQTVEAHQIDISELTGSFYIGACLYDSASQVKLCYLKLS